MSNTENANGLLRVTVHLSLYSDRLTIEEISERIGMLPDSARKKGDLNRAEKPYPKTSWTIKSERHLSEVDEFIAGMNSCLRDILSRLGDHRDNFRHLALQEQEHAGLLIGISADNVPPMIIEGDVLEEISSLHLRYLEIDLIV